VFRFASMVRAVATSISALVLSMSGKTLVYSRRDTGGVRAESLHSARRIAPLNDALCKEELEHILPTSVVGVGNMLQMRESP